MHIKGVKEVELFCREKGLYDDYVHNKLLMRKFNIKSNFVLNSQLIDSQAYKETFPEAKGVWHKMQYNKKERLKFWMVEHGMFGILQFLK